MEDTQREIGVGGVQRNGTEPSVSEGPDGQGRRRCSVTWTDRASPENETIACPFLALCREKQGWGLRGRQSLSKAVGM